MPGTLVSGATAHQFAGNGAGQRQSRTGHMTLAGSSPVSVEADREVHRVRNAYFTSDAPWLSGFSLAHRKEGPT